MTNNDLLQKINDLEMRVEQLEIVRHTYTNVYLKQAFSETYQQWKA